MEISHAYFAHELLPALLSASLIWISSFGKIDPEVFRALPLILWHFVGPWLRLLSGKLAALSFFFGQQGTFCLSLTSLCVTMELFMGFYLVWSLPMVTLLAMAICEPNSHAYWFCGRSLPLSVSLCLSLLSPVVIGRALRSHEGVHSWKTPMKGKLVRSGKITLGALLGTRKCPCNRHIRRHYQGPQNTTAHLVAFPSSPQCRGRYPTRLFIYLFNQPVFIKHKLWAGQSPRCWGDNSDQNKDLCLHRTYI